MWGARALVLALLISAPVCEAAADDSALAIQRIKAAFLYKFAAYVEWPRDTFADAASPIVIGVSGADSLALEVEQAIAGRDVGGRRLQVRRLARGESASDCCQILFVGGQERGRTAQLLADAQGRPVLTVTDAASEHPKGSIINFLAAEDRVRFDISREAAERNGLQLRSQLLGVARRVISQ